MSWRLFGDVKTAFYLELSQQLRKISIIIDSQLAIFLDVLYHGFVFRFQVSHFKEIQYLQNYPGPVDVSTQLSIHGSELLFDTKVLPTYTATIHGLTQQFLFSERSY